jgi:hypothetical protein
LLSHTTFAPQQQIHIHTPSSYCTRLTPYSKYASVATLNAVDASSAWAQASTTPYLQKGSGTEESESVAAILSESDIATANAATRKKYESMATLPLTLKSKKSAPSSLWQHHAPAAPGGFQSPLCSAVQELQTLTPITGLRHSA